MVVLGCAHPKWGPTTFSKKYTTFCFCFHSITRKNKTKNFNNFGGIIGHFLNSRPDQLFFHIIAQYYHVLLKSPQTRLKRNIDANHTTAVTEREMEVGHKDASTNIDDSYEPGILKRIKHFLSVSL